MALSIKSIIGDNAAKKVRHGIYGVLRSVITRFRRQDNTLSENVDLGGQTLSGEGVRARFGGTKPMYIYGEDNEKWLFKEAVNCVGMSKRSGAILTEIGANIQKLVDPDTAIEAKALGIRAHGFGSFQKMVEVDPNAVDLFKWQKNPESYPIEKIEELTPDILREHTTDWLLCNFDTKGENFVIDKKGRVRGIDKEQAFSHIFKEGAQHMNTEFQPNPNNTLYNTIFSKYAKGEMNLNLDDCMGAIQKIEKIPRDEYLNNFKGFLDTKCDGDPEKRKQYEDAIMARKDGLREEYRKFFTGLIHGRVLNTQGKQDVYPLDENNRFIFKDEDRSKVKNVDRSSEMQNKARENAPKRMPIKAKDLDAMGTFGNTDNRKEKSPVRDKPSPNLSNRNKVPPPVPPKKK
ncbi:MAG: hypothetical protein FWD90_13780 [Defluviitaleaceae bacterium]|nr:hypothetical protein [Defluviitaleaceae bacterium]